MMVVATGRIGQGKAWKDHVDHSTQAVDNTKRWRHRSHQGTPSQTCSSHAMGTITTVIMVTIRTLTMAIYLALSLHHHHSHLEHHHQRHKHHHHHHHHCHYHSNLEHHHHHSTTIATITITSPSPWPWPSSWWPCLSRMAKLSSVASTTSWWHMVVYMLSWYATKWEPWTTLLGIWFVERDLGSRDATKVIYDLHFYLFALNDMMCRTVSKLSMPRSCIHAAVVQSLTSKFGSLMRTPTTKACVVKKYVWSSFYIVQINHSIKLTL